MRKISIYEKTKRHYIPYITRFSKNENSLFMWNREQQNKYEFLLLFYAFYFNFVFNFRIILFREYEVSLNVPFFKHFCPVNFAVLLRNLYLRDVLFGFLDIFTFLNFFAEWSLSRTVWAPYSVRQGCVSGWRFLLRDPDSGRNRDFVLGRILLFSNPNIKKMFTNRISSCFSVKHDPFWRIPWNSTWLLEQGFFYLFISINSKNF